MVGEVRTGDEGSAPQEAPRVWEPSRRPIHRAGEAAIDDAKIIENRETGALAAIARYLKRPFVRLVVGLGAFILAAIVYDEYVNFGSWTERAEKPRAADHRGLAPIQKTPDG